MVYIMLSPSHFHGWTLVGETLLCIVHLFLQFKERRARVLQTSLWILVDHCVDGVSSNCYCKFVYVLHLSFFAAN